jgi:hypothetical protein
VSPPKAAQKNSQRHEPSNTSLFVVVAMLYSPLLTILERIRYCLLNN